jgi:hypothetical protein
MVTFPGPNRRARLIEKSWASRELLSPGTGAGMTPGVRLSLEVWSSSPGPSLDLGRRFCGGGRVAQPRWGELVLSPG